MAIAGLNVNIAFRRNKLVSLDVAVTAEGEAKTAGLDVGVLDVQIQRNLTTPEGSQYRDCRPLHCRVPDMKQQQTTIDTFIAVTGATQTGLSTVVQVGFEETAQLQVFLDITADGS